jgi:hypothetical protein
MSIACAERFAISVPFFPNVIICSEDRRDDLADVLLECCFAWIMCFDRWRRISEAFHYSTLPFGTFWTCGELTEPAQHMR